MPVPTVPVRLDPTTLRALVDAAHHGTDWAAIATAGGTFALALVTLVLALKTGRLAKSGDTTARAAQTSADAANSGLGLLERQVDLLAEQTEAARSQGELAEQALNASVRPLLLDVPLHTMMRVPLSDSERLAQRNVPIADRREYEETDVSAIKMSFRFGLGELTVPVRNGGAGIARVTLAQLRGGYRDAWGPPVPQSAWPLAIAPGERGSLMFAWNPEAGELTEGDLLVEVFCSDLAGRQRQSTRLELTKVDRSDRTHDVVDIRPGIDPDLDPVASAE